MKPESRPRGSQGRCPAGAGAHTSKFGRGKAQAVPPARSGARLQTQVLKPIFNALMTSQRNANPHSSRSSNPEKGERDPRAGAAGNGLGTAGRWLSDVSEGLGGRQEKQNPADCPKRKEGSWRPSTAPGEGSAALGARPGAGSPVAPPPQLTQPESTLGGDKAKSKTSAATEKPFEALAGELTSTSPSHPRAAQPSQSSFRRAQGTRRPAARTQGTSLPCCSPQLTPEASTTVPAGRDEEETVLRVLPGPAEEQLDNPWGW